MKSLLLPAISAKIAQYFSCASRSAFAVSADTGLDLSSNGELPICLGMKKPVIARLRRASPLLVCKKCLKRSPEGKAIKREAKHALKRQRTSTLKAPKLVATSCLGICPKRAVVFASGRTLSKGEYVLVSDQRDLDDALEQLGPPGREATAGHGS